MTYNYDGFDSRTYDLDRFSGPRPGTKAPDVVVERSDGTTHRILDFSGDFLVLEMGSRTCPLFQGRRKGMTKLRQKATNTSFAVLYVREAHPGDAIPAHQSLDDKRAAARALCKDDGEARDIFIDDLDGSAHQAYGGFPNSVFIINRHGCVVYFSDWNNPAAAIRALERLQAGQSVVAPAYFKPVPPWVAFRVLRAGGKGALPDFLRSLPRLIWKNLILRSWRIALGRPQPIAADTRC